MPSRWLFRGSWWLCGARCERPSAQHPCGVSSTHRNGRPTGQFGSPAPISHSTQRGHSSAGRAPAWHAGGQRFESAWLHLILRQQVSGVSARLSAKSLSLLLVALTAPCAAQPAVRRCLRSWRFNSDWITITPAPVKYRAAGERLATSVLCLSRLISSAAASSHQF